MEILKAFWTVYCFISVIFTTVFLFNLYRNLRKELGVEKGIDTVKKTMKLVYIEPVDGAYHMYDIVTHTFICQAPTEKELWDIAQSMFPGKSVITVDNTKGSK
jgi:hypothetical protein